MIIHSKNHVTNLDDQCIQPNAVDLRIKDLERLLPGGHVQITETRKKEFITRTPAEQNTDKTAWILYPKNSYDFETHHDVEIPEGMAGWLIVRSTLSRNGIVLSGGLYDAGYKGRIGATLHNMTDVAVHIEKDCRVAQFVMSDSETSHLYDGYYNTQGGVSK